MKNASTIDQRPSAVEFDATWNCPIQDITEAPMKTANEYGHLCMSSTLERDALQISDCLNALEHTIVIAPTSSGMSSQPESLRCQRMLNRVNCHSADQSSLDSTNTALTEMIVNQCTTNLCIKSYSQQA